MEKNWKTKIKNNLPELIELLQCGDLFLAEFRSANVFTKEDEQLIKAARTDIKAASIFFNILDKRGSNAYTVFRAALVSTKQSTVLSILSGSGSSERTNEIPKKSARFSKFSRLPEYVKKFLCDKTKRVLVVSSSDCKLTCDRICEVADRSIDPIPSFTQYSPKTFLEYLDSGEVASTPMAIVNCGNKVELMLQKCSRTSARLILVGGNKVNTNDPKHLSVPEKILWKEISCSYQGQIQRNCEKLTGIEASNSDSFLENIDPGLMLQLVKGEKPAMLKNTILEQVTHYIPRCLIPRDYISAAIFSNDGPDMFFFRGIEKHQLSHISDGSIGTSGDILKTGRNYRAARYIFLESESDFGKICKLIEKRPLHLLEYQEEKLIWVESSGGISAIQQAVDSSQTHTKFDEENFINEVVQDSSKKPVCISDTPGMGKSVLLTNIGIRLKKRVREGHVVFIQIRELVNELKREEYPLNEKLLLASFANLICENELGFQYVYHNKDKLTEILLDGFDEIAGDDIELGYKCIAILQNVFIEGRIWVTTRPHFLIELERKLGVLGFNIKPFELTDQTRFLQKYWCTDSNKYSRSKLKQFAHECLSSVKKNITAAEEDFAGIPLQCRLIAEVYFAEARAYGKRGTGRENRVLNFHVESIEDLYKKLVDNKFEKFCRTYKKTEKDKSLLRELHIYHAYCNIVPDYKFEEPEHTFSINEIYNVGLIESISVDGVLRFLHRTIAEYFVACDTVQSFSSEQADARDYNFLFDCIFDTVPVELTLSRAKYKTLDFKYGVVCHFIDVLMSRFQENLSTNDTYKHTFRLRRIYAFRDIAEACAKNNLVNIFRELLFNFFHLCKSTKSIFSEKFLVICVSCAGTSLLELAILGYKRNPHYELTDIIMTQKYRLLHFAAIAGNYSTINYLVTKENFKDELANKNYANIFHECLVGSKVQNERTVEEKRQIILYLAKHNPELLTSENEKGILALFSSNSHLSLVKAMITVSWPDSMSTETILDFLFKSSRTYNTQEYCQLLQHTETILGKTVFATLLKKVWKKSTLVETIFKNVEADLKLVEFLKTYYSRWTSLSPSVHQIAVMNKKSTSCLKLLLQHIDLSIPQLDRFVAYLLRWPNVPSLEILAEKGYVNANKWRNSSTGDTLLHLIVKKKDIEKYFPILRILRITQTNFVAKNENSKTAIDELLQQRPTNVGFSIINILYKKFPSQRMFLKLKWKIVHYKEIQDSEIKEYKNMYEKLEEKTRMQDSDGRTLVDIAKNKRNQKALRQLLGT